MALQQYYALGAAVRITPTIQQRRSPGCNRSASWIHLLLSSVGLVLLPGVGQAATPDPLFAAHGAVASDHPEASKAGVVLLRAGGNAVDAACATAMALGVVNPHGSGIGGGGFAVVYLAKEKQVHVLDFRERAPAAITPALFFKDGKPDPKLSRQHGLAVAVPGEVMGLSEMVKRWGKLPFSRCVAPAEQLTRGVAATPRVAWMINDVMSKDPFINQVFTFKAPVKPGDRLRRPTLGRALALLRQKGPRAFYQGAIGEDIAAAVRAAGGVMTTQDLRDYTVSDREPITTTYRGLRVVTMPPSSSGGTVVATALAILERIAPKPKDLGHNSSAYLHALTESLKHGFADRARHLGDSDFVQVPLEKLLAPAYQAELAARFKPDAVLPSEKYGMPGESPTLPADGGTAHLSVIDNEGNAVALTTTVNLWFGAHIVSERYGIVLNNQMDDFAMKPGVENAFRLLGTERNAVAPHKRPLSSMTPTLVFDDKGVKIAVGGAGGPTIISGTLQVLLNIVDFGMDAQAASCAARVHHQWMPELLMYEPELPVDVIKALEKRGHKTQSRDQLTKVNVVVRTDKGVEAAAEVRGDGLPAGY